MENLVPYNPKLDNQDTGLYNNMVPKQNNKKPDPVKYSRRILFKSLAMGAGLLLGAGIVRGGVLYWEHENPSSDQIHDSKILFTNQFPTSPEDPGIGAVGLLENAANPVMADPETILIENDPRISYILGLKPELGEKIQLITNSFRVSFLNRASIPIIININELSNILLVNKDELRNQGGRAVVGWENEQHPTNAISAFVLEQKKKRRQIEQISVVGFWTYGHITNNNTDLEQPKPGLRFITTRVPKNQ